MCDFTFINIYEMIQKYINEWHFYIAFTKDNFLTKALLRGKIYGRIVAKTWSATFLCHQFAMMSL